jgi:two-component sensor histidine kinase
MEQLKRLQVAYIPLMADYEPNTAKENEFLQAGIVQSMIVVPMVHHTSLVGFIGFDAVTQPKTWADDIISLLTILGEIIVSAMERRQSQQKIEAALKEKELLLKEIHHRVKNNLQVISSLLNLQSRHITDPQTLEIYRESRNRVKSMALIHEKLYRSADLVQIDFKEYIKALINDLFRSYKIRGAAIQLHVEINDIFLNVGQATPCGLIINELVSNALKHAFPNEQAGSILIEFFAEGENMVINVTDNGVGMSPAIDLTRTESLGLRLVMTLVRQIGGAINLHRQNGTKFSITFPQKNS